MARSRPGSQVRSVRERVAAEGIGEERVGVEEVGEKEVGVERVGVEEVGEKGVGGWEQRGGGNRYVNVNNEPERVTKGRETSAALLKRELALGFQPLISQVLGLETT